MQCKGSKKKKFGLGFGRKNRKKKYNNLYNKYSEKKMEEKKKSFSLNYTLSKKQELK
jgi:hypothetical protein